MAKTKPELKQYKLFLASGHTIMANITAEEAEQIATNVYQTGGARFRNGEGRIFAFANIAGIEEVQQ